MHIDKEHENPFQNTKELGEPKPDVVHVKIPKTKYILKCTLIKSIKSHLDVVHVIKFQKLNIFQNAH